MKTGQVVPEYRQIADVVPEGSRRIARVEHFDISKDEAEFHNLRCAINSRRLGMTHFVRPGRYARLYVNGQLMMSDTPMEQATSREAVELARGRVLIAGLGLGLIVLPILAKPDVESVTVVEKFADVVRLVSPAVRRAAGTDAGKLVVERADIWRWKPEMRRFDFAYLDIWPTINSDDYGEHVALRRKVRRYLRGNGVVRSWEFETLRDLRQR